MRNSRENNDNESVFARDVDIKMVESVRLANVGMLESDLRESAFEGIFIGNVRRVRGYRAR